MSDASPYAVKAIRELQALENQPSADLAKFLRLLLEAAYRRQPGRGAHVKGIRGTHGVTRVGDAISVNTKELVMKVFLDTEENYSVSGYNERASCSFGEIYLGLDSGPEYDRQSTKVNEAIQSITGAEAFRVALEETRKVLAANPAAQDVDVTVAVLAALCTRWFDLPDTLNVIEGDVRFEEEPEPPPLCPGDFAFPSGYIFYPKPGEFLSEAGPSYGRILKQAVGRYVANLRASQKLPEGVLSRAIFEAFPRGEDDLIARTIIGVMMGMLPTVYFNLNYTLEAWQADGGQIFAELQENLKHSGRSDPFVRAGEVLEEPLMRAMQGNPMPPEVWRTAVKDHALGTNPPVQVKQGDKIAVRIKSATQEDLAAGVTDVFPVFGGDRNTAPHPTHACPAYRAAIGIMLGVINGLMEPT